VSEYQEEPGVAEEQVTAEEPATKAYKNQVCPQCHQERQLEKGLLHCKKCNNADTPID
jgi:hypothetical protein